MKKFLSLVLALVMTMSLVTVSAGAKDFTDSSKINYAEAVDVLSEAKVIDGYADGAFNPSNTLTRGAAAKIICNLILGPTAASALVADAAPYKDVAANHPFAGYIAYCQKTGIISGYADGTFKPANSLTGYAFMKMLLGALGYDAETEGYTGPNWSINVAKRAINIGLDDDLVSSFNGVKAVTREEACLYAFNTLKATMVEYDNNNSVTVNGITFTNKSAAKETVNTGKTDGNIGSKDGKMQFAEKYFEDLKGKPTTDEFERPATEWKVKSKSVGTYAKTPDLTYTDKTKISVIYADLGLSDGISKKDVTEYVDGRNAGAFAQDIVKGNTKKVGGNGIQLDVYYDDDAETITFVEVNTYVAKIASVYKATSTKDAYVTLNTSDDGFTTPGVTVGSFETEDFSKDQIVGYTYSFKTGENCIESMVALEKVSGAMSAYTTEGSVTVGGTKYDANKASEAEILNMSQTVDKGTDVTVYLDAYGYALYVDADTNDEYAVILDYAAPYGLNNARVKLLFTDGTTKKVDLKKNITYNNSATANGFNQYDIVSYTVNSDEEYTLTLVADSQTANAGGGFVLKNGATSFSLISGNTANIGGNTHYADGETIFLVADTSDPDDVSYSVYTGISNMPTVTHNGGTAGVATVFAEDGNGKAATVVFVEKNSKMSMTSNNKDIVFVKGNSDKTSYTKDLGTFYEYTAFINGEKTTIKVDTNHRMTSKTLVYGPTYNDKGILTNYEAMAYAAVSDNNFNSVYFTTVTKASVNGVITLGGTPYAYAKDCKTYLMDVDGNLSQIDVTSIGDDANDNVWFKLNSDGLITDLYVETVDVPEAVTPGAGTFSAVMAKGTTAGNLKLTVTSTDVTDSTTTFTAKIYAFALASGKDTAVEVGTVASNTLASGTYTVAPAITGTVNTQVYYAVVTLSDGSVVTTNTIIGG